MAELFRYAAFVSYSSKDARFAQALHRALEGYGIPASLGKFDLIGGGKINRIYPVFRDREELSAGSLGERIEAALKASAALVVVCSPNAAASPWVQKEIDFFVSLGRRDKIFAIIADDAPLLDERGADATLASFPPAFRVDALADANALEPLAADARKGKDGFRNAWLKLVAGMIGVTPGQIIDRDRRRRARERLQWGAGVSALTALSLLAAAAWDARGWRSDLTALAEALASEGRLIESTPLALAGVNGRGAVMPTRGARADDALMAVARGRVLAELGPVVNFTFAADGAKLAVQRNDPGQSIAVYDLKTGAATELGPFGPLYDLALSADGSKLAIRRNAPERPGAIHDVNTRAVIELGPLIDFQLSEDGATLVVRRGDARRSMAAYALKTGGVKELGAPARMMHFLLSANGARVVVRRHDPQSTAAAMDLRTGAITELGALGPLEALQISADGAKLVVRRTDPQWTAALYDLATGAKTELGPLGVLTDFELSADGAKAVTRRRDQNFNVTVQDLTTGAKTELGPAYWFKVSADRARLVRVPREGEPYTGAAYDFASLAKTEIAPRGPFLHADLSADGRRLAVHRGGRRVTSVAYDLTTGAVMELGQIGFVQHFGLAPDGAHLALRRDDPWRTGVVFDLSAPVWTSATPPKGADLAAAVCAANAHAMLPFIRYRGARAEGQDAAVARHLVGRPWNPCDWRGLGAIFPSGEHGDGWFEGPLQWLRLVQVRRFGAQDWACAETVSRASVRARTARAEICARFAAQALSAPLSTP